MRVPARGPDGEADCKHGRLVMADGFVSDAASRMGVAQSKHSRQRPDYIHPVSLQGMLWCQQLYRCDTVPLRHSRHPVCDLSGEFSSAGKRILRSLPANKCGGVHQSEASQFVTLILLLLLAVVLSAMDARSEWRHFRWIQRCMQGMHQSLRQRRRFL